jgi:hypothetical protein
MDVPDLKNVGKTADEVVKSFNKARRLARLNRKRRH